jgi:hypothetical protein
VTHPRQVRHAWLALVRGIQFANIGLEALVHDLRRELDSDPDLAQPHLSFGWGRHLNIAAVWRGGTMTRCTEALIGVVVAIVGVQAASSEQIRLVEVTVARSVASGSPVEPATVFTTDAGEIYVWARLEGAAPGTAIRSEWFYLGGATPRSIGAGTSTTRADHFSIYFSYELPAGRPWPAGDYRVELSAGGRVLGEARFTIASPVGPAPPSAPTPAVPRYIHPRAGYSFVPPAGWVLDDAGPGDGVRLRLENGAGLIEIASGTVGMRMDPTSYAAGWESVSVGPGKLLGEKRFGRVWTLAGEKSYEAVYEGPGVLCKVVFAATADRMFVVTGSFGADEFKVGEGIFLELGRPGVFEHLLETFKFTTNRLAAI